MSTMDHQVLRLRSLLEDWMRNQPDQMGAQWHVRRAKGILFLTAVKAGFMFSGTVGYGFFIKQLDEGAWSGPVSVMMAGAGAGLQAGLCKNEIVILMTSARAVNMFESHGQVRLGAEYALAIGPAGLNIKGDAVVNRKGASAQGTISTSMGLFLGLSMDSSVLVSNHWVNHAYYRSSHAGLKNILRGKISIPQERMENLQKLVNTIQSIKNSKSWTKEYFYEGDDPYYDMGELQDEFLEQELKRDSRILPTNSLQDPSEEDSHELYSPIQPS